MILSIVMPCLNEAHTLAVCIQKASSFLTKNNLEGEVIIADNGSTDASVEVAMKSGARVVPVLAKGYGAALVGGIKAAKGKYVVMGDADDSYDFSNLLPFFEKLDEGYDLVMGNRFKGGIKDGAMPFLHRYLGNPVLSFIGRLFYKSPVNDFHCGLRAFTKEAYEKMELKSTGMEFASEMVVKATMLGLNISEVPTTLSKDGRNRPPHLNTWRDGWRHLRFLIMYAPNWLLLYPGIILLLCSLILGGLLTIHPISVFNLQLDIHTLLYVMVAALMGTQLLFLYTIVRRYAFQHIIPSLPKASPTVTLEKSLIVGITLLLVGLMTSFYTFSEWVRSDFGNLNPVEFMRYVIPSVFSICVGFQTIVSSFVVALINDQKN
ncbi:MAG: glycosyltransferase family 2 protein [Marinilabiliaceae bacterium]|nr:glycosyltransferase family 2 protein [Marinilabiliaceae bacterium]